MARYMFLYRESQEQNAYSPSPQEMQQMMQKWMQWIQKGTEAGWLVDGGDALKPEAKWVASDQSVTDRPMVESKEVVGGYSIVEAENLADAIEIAKGCPMPESGGAVEVRPVTSAGA